MDSQSPLHEFTETERTHKTHTCSTPALRRESRHRAPPLAKKLSVMDVTVRGICFLHWSIPGA